MNNDNNNNAAMYGGGILVFIIIIAVVLESLEKLFIQIGRTFDAMTGMLGSVFMMLFTTLIMLGLIAVAAGLIFAAIYFSYKYYKMVKRGTDLKAYLDYTIGEFTNQVNIQIEEIKSDTKDSLNHMDRKLSHALDKPAVAPMPDIPLLPATDTASVASDVAAGELNSTDPSNASSDQKDLTAADLGDGENQEILSAQNVSNPY